MLLTLGMATANDFHGVAFTVQSLKLHHDLTDCEILVVDNAPDSKHGKEVQSFTNGVKVRYIAMPDQNGTTQTRERVFAEAQGEAVLVMDCHVLFIPGAIAKLKQYFRDNPNSLDILSGPLLLTDNPRHIHTHFNDVWRGGMWGIWGNAWRCTCDDPLYFTTLQRGEEIAFADLASSKHENASGCQCGKAFPKTGWSGHERALTQAGFVPMGLSDNDPPFAIPAMGLGVFGCRKDAWPGFNANFRGFGGEEFFIHEKFRQRGGRALCLPFLKWWHRFGRPDGTQYVNRVFDRVRNYVIGHGELGLPLEAVHRQFVSLETYGRSLYDHLKYEHGDGDDKLKGKDEAGLARVHRNHVLSESDWQALVADPVGTIDPPSHKREEPKVTLDTGRPQPPPGSSLDEIFSWCTGVKRDLDKHLPAMRETAKRCQHVTEFTKRRESTVAFLAARPNTLISYQLEKDVLHAALTEAIKKEGACADCPEPMPGRKVETHTVHWGRDSLEAKPIEETDLLFIDTIHTADRLKAELARHADKVRRFIVLRGTGANGVQGEGGGDGLFLALKPWMDAHPQWFVVWHTDVEYGMTAIGCNPEDRPPAPVHAWAPGYGPGTELKAILASMDVNPSPSCDCNAKAELMDKWGVEGCKAQRDVIVGWLKDGAPRWKWTDQLAAAAKAVKTGLAWRINPLDPFGSLVDEAIRRAEVNGIQ